MHRRCPPRVHACTFLVALAWVGCKSQPEPVQEPAKVELPSWLAQGKQTWGSEQEGFFGIGTGDPEIEDQRLRESVAIVRAREAAMQTFETWYTAWLEANAGQASADLATRAEASIQVIERWTGPDGRMFVLAHLSPDFMREVQR